MVEQNLFICLAMSAGGGFLSVAARGVVLDHKRKQAKKVLDRQQEEQAAQEEEERRLKKVAEDALKMMGRSSSLLLTPPPSPTKPKQALSSSPSKSLNGINNSNNSNNKKKTIGRVLTASTSLPWLSSFEDSDDESPIDGNGNDDGNDDDYNKDVDASETSISSFFSGFVDLESQRQSQRKRREEQITANNKDSTTKSASSSASSSSQSAAAPPAGSRFQMYKMLAIYLVLCAMLKPLQFFAPWFGPVTITWPVYVGSRMVSNLLIVGVLMGHEVFDKPSQVATMVVVSSVVFITLTGPATSTTTTSQEEERNIKELVQGNWIAMIWLTILAVVFVVSSGLIMLNVLFKKFVRKTLKLSPFWLEVFIFLNAITTSTLSFTTSRGASTLLDEPNDHVYRVTLTAVSWYIFMWWMVESYVEGRDVRSLKLFVPTETLGSVLLNFITGLLVWDDSSAIVSWPGYLTSIALLAMGVYLFSDLDFFQRQLDEVQEYFYESDNDGEDEDKEEDWRTRSEVEDVLMPHQRSMLKHQQQQQQALPLPPPSSSTFLSEVDGTTSGCQTQSPRQSQIQRPKLEKTFSDPEVGTRSRRFLVGIHDRDDDVDDDDENESCFFFDDDESLGSLESDDGVTITA
eukprot:CAMPEP_0113462192 /NCGR_PEP_ID=MMETSP0014_2-20120614/11951_1 /TAXON_ID=2857 /ORGANISM="Nitzschia sp." /LENGTH=629 /DNA_ID=CAMNT_0000354019 /DNA_START=300 /DNA_END=2189 /DNA_ORIENTATION=- /assembly_acc=CAM_ASM_000159